MLELVDAFHASGLEGEIKAVVTHDQMIEESGCLGAVGHQGFRGIQGAHMNEGYERAEFIDPVADGLPGKALDG